MIRKARKGYSDLSMAFLTKQNEIRNYLINQGLKKYEPQGDYFRIKPGFEEEELMVYYDLNTLIGQRVVWIWEDRLSVYRRNFENFHKLKFF